MIQLNLHSVTRSTLFVAAIFTAYASSTVQSAIVFNNFGPGDDFAVGGRILEGPNVNSVGDVNQAAQFTVGASPALLTSVSLGIFVNDSPSIGTGPLDIVVAADAAGAPGATLRTLPINVNATGQQVVTGVDDGSFMLEANTDYWIIADGEDEFRGSWNFNTIGDVGPTAGQTEPNPWNVRPPEDRYAFRVEGRLIPEPSSALLMCVLLLGFAVRLPRD